MKIQNLISLAKEKGFVPEKKEKVYRRDGKTELYITSNGYINEAIDSYNLEKILELAYEEGKKDERQFILNILDGVDKADEEMENRGEIVCGGTKAIRFALSSRVIN